jgi:hypothetical protein
MSNMGTQNVSPNIQTANTLPPNTFTGTVTFDVNPRIGTVVAAVTATPPTNAGFPNLSVAVSPTACDNAGNFYTCVVPSGSTINNSTTGVSFTAQITSSAPQTQALPTPLMMGLNLTFGSSGGGPGGGVEG